MHIIVFAILLINLHCSSSTRNFYYNRDKNCKTKRGDIGVCKPLTSCPSAVEDFRNRRGVAICYNRYTNPIVCCPNDVNPAYTNNNDNSNNKPYSLVCENILRKPVSTYRLFKRYAHAYRIQEIWGGEEAAPNEFPHMAALGYNRGGKTFWGCGGSLIHKKYVLTAAHCRNWPGYGSPRFVRLGDRDLESSEDNVNVQTRSIVEIISYDNYTESKKYNDIALLELDDDVIFNKFVKPACLHRAQHIEGNSPIVIGWGTTEEEKESMGRKLMKVELQFQSMNQCTTKFEERVDPFMLRSALHAGLQEDSMLCVGVPEGGKDSCDGDSGGPLQMKSTSPQCEYDIVGIVSFGVDGCAQPGVPAIYTRISYFIPGSKTSMLLRELL